MLLFLISCVSLLLLSQSFLDLFSSSMNGSKMWAFASVFCSIFVPLFSRRRTILIPTSLRIPRSSIIPSTDDCKSVGSRTDVVEETCFLGLPDLALDCILDRLGPTELGRMAGVCRFLRERCTSNHLWEKHFQQKWGAVFGESAYREWHSSIASNRTPKSSNGKTHSRRRFQFFSIIFRRNFQRNQIRRSCSRSFGHENSIMSRYLALQTGKFWFPAQVFNREVQNGYVGFTLSCYDAKLSYVSTSDNFIARYASHGRNMVEENVEWDRIRAANALNEASCLDELKPGDHIEVQWRKNKAFPYGWWYGVVGHAESCRLDQFNCHCHLNDEVILEFKQYSVESMWRKRVVSRRNHSETGNDRDGYYGGIRKVCKSEEIQKWRHFWPNCSIQ